MQAFGDQIEQPSLATIEGMVRKGCADKASTEVRRGRDWDTTAEKLIQISHQMGVSIDDLRFHLCFSGYALVDMKPIRELCVRDWTRARECE